MNFQRFEGVQLESIYCGLPETISNLASLPIPPTEISRFSSLRDRIGVNSTRVEAYAGELTEICIKVIAQSLDDAGLGLEDISTIVCVTQTNIYTIPGLSSLIQEKIQFPMSTRFIDINQGCSGFVDALQLAAERLTRDRPHALVVTLESMSSILDPNDFGNRLLFGDATSVTLLSFNDDAEIMRGFMRSDGRNFRGAYLQSPYASNKTPTYFVLNGPRILSLALTAFEELLVFLKDLNESVDQIDYVIPHQANRFILDSLIERYSLDSRKFIVEMSDVGNTSCNSIPLAICIANNTRNVSNKKCVLLGFGNGLSWGALRINFGNVRLKLVG